MGATASSTRPRGSSTTRSRSCSSGRCGSEVARRSAQLLPESGRARGRRRDGRPRALRRGPSGGRRLLRSTWCSAPGWTPFTWRRPYLLRSLRVFEVDHPVSQDYKRERIAALGLPESDALAWAPVDFERETLRDGLTRAGFDWSRPACFSWLGVTMYLTIEAVEATLRTIAECAPGSEVVFSYGRTDEHLDDIAPRVPHPRGGLLRRASASRSTPASRATRPRRWSRAAGWPSPTTRTATTSSRATSPAARTGSSPGPPRACSPRAARRPSRRAPASARRATRSAPPRPAGMSAAG